MARLRRIAIAIALILSGALFGPFLYFAAVHLIEDRDQLDAPIEAERLMVSIDRQFWASAPRFMATMLPDETGSSCGYSARAMMPGDDGNPRIVLRPGLNDRWTPGTGYEDLKLWKMDQRHTVDLFARSKPLATRLSIYSMRVLSDCIDHTALASACAAYARSRIPGGYVPPLETRPEVDTTRENLTICTYLDGIAARAGKPLGVRTPAEKR